MGNDREQWATTVNRLSEVQRPILMAFAESVWVDPDRDWLPTEAFHSAMFGVPWPSGRLVTLSEGSVRLPYFMAGVAQQMLEDDSDVAVREQPAS